MSSAPSAPPHPSPQFIRVLVVEDNPTDAEILIRELRQAQYDPQWQRVETEEAFAQALRSPLDLILADYRLPRFDGLRALDLVRESGRDIPFILVSGTIGEEAAVAALKSGASDYLLKDRLARLGSAVAHALQSKQLRDDHRHQTEQLRLQAVALQTAANAILITDVQGVILWANPAFTHLTGYTLPEAAGQTPRLLKSGAHDREFYEELWQTILRGETFQGEIINRRKDGTHFCTEQTITPVRMSEGAITHFVGILNDVTARRNAEDELRSTHARLQQILAHSSAVVYCLKWGPEGLVPLLVSDNVSRLLGSSPTDCLQPDWWKQQVHPEDLPATLERLAELRKEHQLTVEYRLRHRDGRYRWVEDSMRVVLDQAGETTEGVGVWTEITSRKYAEEQLRQRAEELDRFNRLAVGRELRMIQLKQEVNELRRRLGEEPPYALAFGPGETGLAQTTDPLPERSNRGNQTSNPHLP